MRDYVIEQYRMEYLPVSENPEEQIERTIMNVAIKAYNAFLEETNKYMEVVVIIAGAREALQETSIRHKETLQKMLRVMAGIEAGQHFIDSRELRKELINKTLRREQLSRKDYAELAFRLQDVFEESIPEFSPYAIVLNEEDSTDMFVKSYSERCYLIQIQSKSLKSAVRVVPSFAVCICLKENPLLYIDSINLTENYEGKGVGTKLVKVLDVFIRSHSGMEQAIMVADRSGYIESKRKSIWGLVFDKATKLKIIEY